MSSNSRLTVAIHALTWLAGDRAGTPNAAGTSPQIADSVNTNPVVIRRLLGDLRKGGLVSSHAGRRGGWQLARPADRITLADVRRALGPDDLFALHASEPSPTCWVATGIPPVLERAYAAVEDAVHRELARTTLADVLTDTRAGARG